VLPLLTVPLAVLHGAPVLLIEPVASICRQLVPLEGARPGNWIDDAPEKLAYSLLLSPP
jgi:hypothetical protein